MDNNEPYYKRFLKHFPGRQDVLDKYDEGLWNPPEGMTSTDVRKKFEQMVEQAEREAAEKLKNQPMKYEGSRTKLTDDINKVKGGVSDVTPEIKRVKGVASDSVKDVGKLVKGTPSKSASKTMKLVSGDEFAEKIAKLTKKGGGEAAEKVGGKVLKKMGGPLASAAIAALTALSSGDIQAAGDSLIEDIIPSTGGVGTEHSDYIEPPRVLGGDPVPLDPSEVESEDNKMKALMDALERMKGE